MLFGALGGALIGLIIGIVMAASAASGRKKANAFIVSLATEGPQAMRARIDAEFPYAGRLDVKNVRTNRRRVAALSLVGDLGAIEREIAACQGKPELVCQVQGIGLLALALYGPDAAGAAARLTALAQHTKASVKGLAKKIVVPWTEGYAALAAALAGQGPAPSDIVTLEKSVMGEPLVHVVVWQALVRVLEASAEPQRATRFRGELDRMMAMPAARAA
jgi:hypothetical protein